MGKYGRRRLQSQRSVDNFFLPCKTSEMVKGPPHAIRQRGRRGLPCHVGLINNLLCGDPAGKVVPKLHEKRSVEHEYIHNATTYQPPTVTQICHCHYLLTEQTVETFESTHGRRSFTSEFRRHRTRGVCQMNSGDQSFGRPHQGQHINKTMIPT